MLPFEYRANKCVTQPFTCVASYAPLLCLTLSDETFLALERQTNEFTTTNQNSFFLQRLDDFVRGLLVCCCRLLIAVKCLASHSLRSKDHKVVDISLFRNE